MATSVIRNFIAKQLFKQKGAIANNKAVEFSANALENRLKNLGIDPNLITSEKELNQLLGLVKQAEDRAFQQQFRGMLDRAGEVNKKGEVFDLTGKKINTSKGIMAGKEINEQTLKESLMKTDNPFSDLVNTPRPKTLKEREAEVLAAMEKSNKESVARIKQRKMIEDAIDNTSPSLTGDTKYDATLVAEDLAERMGKVYDDLDQMERLDLYDQAYTGLSAQRFKGFKKPKDSDPEDMAQGGRAGFSKGLGFFSNLFGKGGKMFRKRGDVPTSVFSEKKGPITIEDMANISPNELRKIRRTQELGLYDETPEILKAGNLFERFTKKVGNKRVIDYDRAEFILNRKLKGDETLNELLQIEYQTRPGRADGGRAGFDMGGGATGIKLFPRASGSQVGQEVGPGIKISERDLNYGITGLLQGDKFFGGAGIDKGKVKIDVVTPEGETLFKDTIGKKDAVNFILGMGDPQGDKFQIKTDKNFENMQLILKKSFASGGRVGYKLGSIDKARRAFLKTLGAAGAGITAFKTGLLSLGKGADAVKNMPPIKTPITKLEGTTTQMPDWFPSFVNKFRDEGKATNVFKQKKVEVSKEEFDQAFKEGKGENYYTDAARTPEYKANNPDHMDYFKLVDTDERIFTTYTNDKVPGVRVDDMDGNVDVMFENDYSQPVSINYTAPGKKGPETGRADLFVQGEAKIETKPKGEFVANDVETYATDPDGGFEAEDVIADTLDDMMEGKTRQMEEYVTGKKTKLSKGEGKVIEAEIRADQAAEAAAEEAADDFASGGIARMLGE